LGDAGRYLYLIQKHRMKSDKYKRGSEWRRWDLHIHTPKSIVQFYGGDTEENWDSFVDKLSKLPDEIKVVGITDYLFIDGYEKVLTYKDKLTNLDLIIPNIEFRLNKFANGKKRLNLHILFDPERVQTQDIKEQLLSCLSKAYLIDTGEEWNQTPTIKSLNELGKSIKNKAPEENSIHSKTDLEIGFENITYDLNDILLLLEKNCFKDKYLIGLGYSEWDQFRWDQSAAEKRHIINKAHFLLTNNKSLDEISGHKEKLIENGFEKLILHSSDAHKEEDLQGSKLWVKADPSFSGLKQIINENERVYLGEDKPYYKNDFQVIDSIKIGKSNGWFKEDQEILLNDSLVTIIGGRGSGKSALAEMIALGVGLRDNNTESFITKALKYKDSISTVEVTITWKDGTKTIGGLEKMLENEEELIQFLPQSAVEELCSPAGNKKLITQIESVIYDSLDTSDRYESSNFTELKGIKLQEFETQINKKTEVLNNLNSRIYDLEEKSSRLDEKINLKKECDTNLKKLKEKAIKLPKEDEDKQNKLSNLRGIERKIEKYIAAKNRNLKKIDESLMRIKLIKSDISNLETDLKNTLKELLVDTSEVENLSIKVQTEDFIRVFQSNKTSVKNEIEQLKTGDATKLLNDILDGSEIHLEKGIKNFKDVKTNINSIESQTKQYQTQIIRFQKHKKEILDLSERIETLTDEIEKIKSIIIPEIKSLHQKRLEVFGEGITLVNNKQKALQKIYKPLQDTLDEGNEADQMLQFISKVNFDTKQMSNNGLDIIDRGRKGNYREESALYERLESFWNEIKDGLNDGDIIKNSMNSLYKSFQGKPSNVSIKEQIRNSYTTEDFYNWLFSLEYYDVTSTIAFGKTPLESLSPGQKGIALLLLFLAIDKRDHRPLIIDQPEDNLDSLSIYNDIIEYFKKRKLSRQIIIVSHNPNLVVNTDSEQVIIASFDGEQTPRIEYITGSLESHAEEDGATPVEDLPDRILEVVCNILEGGRVPMKKRSDKYLLSPKIAQEYK